MITLTKTSQKAFIFLLLVFCTYGAKAQRADSLTYYRDTTYGWGGYHLGFGSYFFTTGVDIGVLIHNDLVIATKFDYNTNPYFLNHSITHTGAFDASLLFGKKLTHEAYSNWTLLSGITASILFERGDLIGTEPDQFFGGTQNVYGEGKTYRSLGVPVAIKFTTVPSAGLGFDFTGNVNANQRGVFFSLTFGILFGELRTAPPHPAKPKREPPKRPPLPRFLQH